VGDAGNDWLRDNRVDDALHGGARDDQLKGGEGEDILAGDTGFDACLENAGTDTAVTGETPWVYRDGASRHFDRGEKSLIVFKCKIPHFVAE